MVLKKERARERNTTTRNGLVSFDVCWWGIYAGDGLCCESVWSERVSVWLAGDIFVVQQWWMDGENKER